MPLATEPEPQGKAVEYTWRTDLSASSRHWGGWFTGLDAAFLGEAAAATPATAAPRVRRRVARLLIVAGRDRLDTALEIAHMQGRFGLKLFPQCGHHVHEEQPKKVGLILSELALRCATVSLPVRV